MSPLQSVVGIVESTAAIIIQGIPGPGFGPEGLVAYWAVVIRAGWFLVGFLAVAFLSRVVFQPILARVIRRRNPNNPTLWGAILLYFQVFVLLVAILVGAGVAGYGGFLSDSALVISAVALAIGVAAQEVIGSLVSGVALVLDPEFNVGDYIKWTDGQGIVQSIALRVTRVETHDGELVTIPNTILTTQEVTRPYGRGSNRVVQELGLAYEDDVGQAMVLLEEVATTLDGILAEPPPVAYVDELGDDAVSVRVHYWIEDPNRRDILAIRSAYARATKQRLEDADITISPASERDLQGRIGIEEPGWEPPSGISREGSYDPR